MAIYETIPTFKLSEYNELASPVDHLPELVHLNDAAKTVFLDFSKILPATISRETPIDVAIHKMKVQHLPMLLVEDNGQVVGLISIEDIISERPILIMREKGLGREEVTVGLLMRPREEIYAIDSTNLKKAQVGHILNTIKQHSASYLLVIKKSKNKHIIKGVFAASQIGRQLHFDLSSITDKSPETIFELHRERKV